jgi:hypothetical protein
MPRWLICILTVCLIASLSRCAPRDAYVSAVTITQKSVPFGPARPAPCCCAPGNCHMADCNGNQAIGGASRGCSSRCRGAAPVSSAPSEARILIHGAILSDGQSTVLATERPRFSFTDVFSLCDRASSPPHRPPRIS